MTDLFEKGLYYCEECDRNHKFTSKIGIAHGMTAQDYHDEAVREIEEANLKLEPEGGDTPKGESDEVGLGEDGLYFTASVVTSPGSEAPTPAEILGHFAEQITTLSKNDQIISQRLDEIAYALAEPAREPENPQGNWDYDFEGIWDKLPAKLQDAAIDLLGAVSVFLRGGPAEVSEDEQVIRGAVKLLRIESDDRIARRAAQIAASMADPNLDLYTRKREPEKLDEKEVSKLE